MPDPAMQDWRQIYGRNVRRLRQKRGLTQEELAFESEIDLTYMGGIERGRRKPARNGENCGRSFGTTWETPKHVKALGIIAGKWVQKNPFSNLCCLLAALNERLHAF
jgi:DNA-binding XRE family transcriptional regulator